MILKEDLTLNGKLMLRKPQIPIILVSSDEGVRIADEQLVVAERTTAKEAISRRGRMDSDTEIAIVGIND